MFSYDMETAIDRAVDQAFVLFQTFGWHYHDSVPDRARVEQALRDQVESVLEEDTRYSASGRFHVERYEDSHMPDEINIFLDLGSFLDDN